MPATPAWLAAVESMLNRNIDAQPAASALLRRRLTGKSLQVDVQGLMRLRVEEFGGRLLLSEPADGAPTARAA